jgi:ankyrin repeat protein
LRRDIIRQLLARGSDPTSPADNGTYPLTAAAEVGFTEIIPDLAHADRYR